MVDFEEVNEQVWQGVSGYVARIKEIVDDQGLEPPLEEFSFSMEPGGFKIRRVPRPSRLISHLESEDQRNDDDRIESIKAEEMEDVAKWFAESDQGYPPHPAIEDTIESKEDLIEYYISDLSNFSETVIDYQTGIEYPEEDIPVELTDRVAGLTISKDAFDLAFGDEFKPRYPGTGEYHVMVVLHSFSGLGAENSLNLQPLETNWEKREYDIELLSDISISKLTDSEKSGLATYVKSRQLRNEPHATPSGMDGPQYKIDFTFEINDRSSTQVHRQSNSESTATHACEKASDLAYDVLTGLRLFKPSSSSAYLGPAYELKTNWHSRTLGVAGIGHSNIHKHTEYRSNFYRYHMRPHEAPYFESFWDEYGDVTNDDSLSNPTRRFNQIYQKSSVEDQILDSFIGIESSILADTDAMYSYRLPIRTLLLLHEKSKYSGEYLFDFSELLYAFRNNIVHNNKSLELLIQREKDRGTFSDSSIESDITQYEFRDRAKYLLAKTILRYSNICGTVGVGINEFNREVLSAHANDLLKNLPALETQLEQKLKDRI